MGSSRGREMWLRDFLPKPRGLHPELTRLRVVTYDYSSLAMIRLEEFPAEGLKLQNCGLLLLSTPHSGAVQADWKDFWLPIAKAGGSHYSGVQTYPSLPANAVATDLAKPMASIQYLWPSPAPSDLHEFASHAAATQNLVDYHDGIAVRSQTSHVNFVLSAPSLRYGEMDINTVESSRWLPASMESTTAAFRFESPSPLSSS
ncbi:uncharacterized protein LA080_004831 [Diaporthe eres]|nr:uncharacterized protein LA080_004831 [Diaporthe eres]